MSIFHFFKDEKLANAHPIVGRSNMEIEADETKNINKSIIKNKMINR